MVYRSRLSTDAGMRFTVTAAAYHVLLLQTSHKKGLRLHTWLLKMKTLLVISASLCIRLLLHSLLLILSSVTLRTVYVVVRINKCSRLLVGS